MAGKRLRAFDLFVPLAYTVSSTHNTVADFRPPVVVRVSVPMGLKNRSVFDGIGTTELALESQSMRIDGYCKLETVLRHEIYMILLKLYDLNYMGVSINTCINRFQFFCTSVILPFSS